MGWNGLDIHNRQIRLTDERQEHIEVDHPEMSGEIDRIQETLLNPDIIVRSRTDPDVELFLSTLWYNASDGEIFIVVVKVLTDDIFIITAYFTDKVKRGEILWKRR